MFHFFIRFRPFKALNPLQKGTMKKMRRWCHKHKVRYICWRFQL